MIYMSYPVYANKWMNNQTTTVPTHLATTYIEKGNFKELTVREALPQVAKMLCSAHSEARENSFEFEASWICPETNFKHAIVPFELRKTLVVAAEKELEEEMMAE